MTTGALSYSAPLFHSPLQNQQLPFFPFPLQTSVGFRIKRLVEPLGG